MGSHRDEDVPLVPKALRELAESDMKSPAEAISEAMASLRQRADELTLQRRNLITAGRDDESVLAEAREKGILIRRLEDDPDRVLRISVGAPVWDLNQAYLVFRGDPDEVYRLLRRAMRAIAKAGMLEESER